MQIRKPLGTRLRSAWAARIAAPASAAVTPQAKLSDVGEELEGGVGVLSVFGHVEALELRLRADAEDAEFLQGEEDRKAGSERPDSGHSRADELHAEDVESERASREVHQVLHHDVRRVLCAGEAGLDKREAL